MPRVPALMLPAYIIAMARHFHDGAQGNRSTAPHDTSVLIFAAQGRLRVNITCRLLSSGIKRVEYASSKLDRARATTPIACTHPPSGRPFLQSIRPIATRAPPIFDMICYAFFVLARRRRTPPRAAFRQNTALTAKQSSTNTEWASSACFFSAE